MDVLYLYKHSENDDFEIRHSLRSIAQHAPYIRKVWIYGDKPAFLTDDKSLVEHIPDNEYLARVLGIHPPITNTFLLLFLSSLIPDLSSEYLFFADDNFLLKDFPITEARKDRYLEDLTTITNRGQGLWKEQLWRTHDLLLRLKYTGYNFETHVPSYFTRKRVLEAYCDFRDFITEDRWYGMMGITAILNHAHKQEKNALIPIHEENSRCGFWGKPPTHEEVVKQSQGKMFFNFDDAAFGEVIRRFLKERFPHRSQYEKE